MDYNILCANLGIGAQITETEGGARAILELMPELQNKATDIDMDARYKSIEIGKQRLAPIVDFCERLGTNAANVIKEKKFPIVLGGDHAVAAGTWSGIITALSATEEFGLIWLDAHLDSNTYETSPSKAYHGMPLAALLGYGEPALCNLLVSSPKLNPKNVVVVGARSYEDEEHALLERIGVTIIYADDVHSKGMRYALDKAVHIATNGTKGFGVSLDLDMFDPKFAPGVGSREPMGIDPEEFLQNIDRLFNAKLKAFEIAEYNPMLDIDSKTGKIAQSVINAVISML